MWINFKELRRQIDFKRLLELHNVELKKKGEQMVGFCPLPNHGGSGKTPSFSANIPQGIFQCFGCGAKGNALDFAVLMAGKDPRNGQQVREVALELQQNLGVGSGTQPQGQVESRASTRPAEPSPVETNAPLDFELKGLDPSHPYIRARRIDIETAEHFGIGVAPRGLFKGRLAIPLQDRKGELIGYAGRVIDDATVSSDNPKYRFPAPRERNGVKLEFRKSEFLYNGWRFKNPVNDLVVVEGFVSVWWLHQNGLPPTVALMGSDPSEDQIQLILETTKADGRIWLIPDGDTAGKRCGEKLVAELVRKRFVRWLNLPEKCQPTDMSQEELRKTLRW